MKRYLLFVVLFVFGICSYPQNTKAAKPAFEKLIEYPNIRDFTLSNDGNEAYFTVQSPLGELSAIAKMKRVDAVWQKPELASFSGKYEDLEPFLSPAGLRLYFASNRPLTGEGPEKDFDIWYVERTDLEGKWGEPIPIGAPVNTTHNEFYPSVSENNNLYFTSDRPGSKGKDDVFFSPEASGENGKYLEPQSLGKTVNSEGYEFNAYVSPDESFLIFSGYNREDGLGSGDLYISYRDEEGNWSVAVNLGENINSKQMDYCPFVDRTTQTLYFTSRRSNMEQVSGFQSLADFLRQIRSYENGWSRIYKVAFELQK